MKFILYFTFISLMSSSAFTQQSVNIGFIYGQRVNYRQPSFNNVLGASLEYSFPFLLKETDFRITAGIEGTQPTVLASNGVPVYYDNYFVIPVRVGLQKFVYDDKAFVFAEPGVVIGFFPHDRSGETDTKAGFSYAVGAAYRHILNETKYVQGSLCFNSNPYGNLYKFSWISLRVAYGIKWGN